MVQFLDKLEIPSGGVEFYDASSLGITNASDRDAYPLGLTSMTVGGGDWPVDGVLLTMYMADVRFGQLLISNDSSWTAVRGIVGNGPALQEWRTLYGEDWTVVTAFENGWTNYGSVFAVAAYRKDSHGTVRLKGLIKNGGTSNVRIFMLPVGYRPSKELIFLATSVDNVGQIRVKDGGGVFSYSPTSSSWVSLDGITFAAEQ